MTEHNQSQSAPATDAPPAFSSAAGEPARKRCAHCGRPFGLIRRRRAGMQFCSLPCMNEQANGVRNAVRARARWYEYLYQRR